MSTHNYTTRIHKIFHTTGYCHLFGCGLFCFHNNIINLIVSLDFNQLIGTISHLCQEIRIVLTNPARFRIVVVHRKIALIGGKHTCEINLLDFPAGNVLHKTFFLRGRVKAVCIGVETLLDLFWSETRIAVSKYQIILC